MEIRRVLKANWLSLKPAPYAETLTTLISIFVALVTWLYWNDIAGLGDLLPASGESVFVKHEYWRLWTSLLIHGDVGHIVSNAILFIPLSFFLTGYFGPFYFPVLGFLMGGLTNYVALKTMAPTTSLLGISGLVYWMGASWLTLYLLVGTGESMRRRLGKALFIAAALFLPQTFEPHVSYISHFYGFVFGVPSAAIYYFFAKEKFAAAEVYEYVIEDEPLPFEAIAGQDPGAETLSAH